MYDSIIILGPTASGKTTLSIDLAKELSTEIINADSMYIYKDLSIGTAKPTLEEMSGIKHHLIGFLETNKSFNVSEYKSMASTVINNLIENNLVPIIVGGTGFYIDSLINTYSYGETTEDIKIRNKLKDELDKYGKEYMYNRLTELDPDTAKKLHMNDTFRVLRALEIIEASGIKKSDIINSNNPVLYNPLIIGLNMPREVLYQRINKRVDIMVDNGLIDEVKSLYQQGFDPNNSQAMKGIGYKELIEYFDNKISLDAAIDKIKQHSRNYAKRQLTWFRRNKDIIWFDPLQETNLTKKIVDLYKKRP